MEIAEKADRPAVGAQARQHPHRAGLGQLLRRCRVAVLVERPEMTSVDGDVRRVLAADVAPMRRLGDDCGRISAPENCEPKVPLPIR